MISFRFEIVILFETDKRTNSESAFWFMVAEWFVLCKSPEETSSNKQYLTTSRTVKYWRGDLTNQLRDYKNRHIKPIFRSDYSDHSFQNNHFLIWNFPIVGKAEQKRTVKRKWTVKRLKSKVPIFLKMNGQHFFESGFFKMNGQHFFQSGFFEKRRSNYLNQKWTLLIVPKYLI